MPRSKRRAAHKYAVRNLPMNVVDKHLAQRLEIQDGYDRDSLQRYPEPRSNDYFIKFIDILETIASNKNIQKLNRNTIISIKCLLITCIF